MGVVFLNSLVRLPLPGTSLCPTHPLVALLGNLVPIKALFDVSLAREFTVLFWFTKTRAGILVLSFTHCEPLGRCFNLIKPKSPQPYNGDALGYVKWSFYGAQAGDPF